MMNQQDILKKVGSILTELNDQYQFLSQNPEKLNDLEMELFLANANFLTDHVEIIRKLNKKNKESAANVAQETKSTIPVIEPVVIDEVNTQPLKSIYEENEVEERVDLKSESDLRDKVEENVAETISRDFFTLDKTENTFEFDLGNHSHNLDGKFDYEAKPVEQIFDRVLSADEERILEEKKRLFEKLNEPAPKEIEVEHIDEDDEIGPEPFLIEHEIEEPVLYVEPIKEIVEPVAPIVKVEPIVEKIEQVIIEDKPVFTPTAIPVNEVKPEIKTAVETDLKPTLNDILASSKPVQNAPTINPIIDLKQGINLNEKLLFIKDLFNGYNLAYSEAIDLINKMNNFETADLFLKNNYAVKNNWAAKQETVDRFYEILNRRFLNG
jgi:hypothetical protein